MWICVDFRKLNEVTENEAYGLPNILEILESLDRCFLFEDKVTKTM